MLSLSFMDEHGNLIPVNDSRSEIEINIPTKKKDLNPPVNFVNPENDTVTYHTFRITHEDTAFSIRVEPFNETRLVVYLRHRKRPNETHFDYQTLLPDFTSCLPPEDENCTVVSEFMQCLGVVNVTSTYHGINFTKPGQPKSCGPPQNDSVPKPAPTENGEEEVSFKCPDICRHENLTFTNCSCDEIPNVFFLFNKTIAEDVSTCRHFITFSLCPNDTLLCKNSVNLLSCYALEFQRYQKCREILYKPRKLFYDLYGKCLEDPFKIYFNHSFAKVGKWYVGVKVYIPPFVNHTNEEEEPLEDLANHTGVNSPFPNWWNIVLNMTSKKEVKKFLQKYVVDVMSYHNNKTVKLKHCRWFNRWRCKTIVNHWVWQWERWMKNYNGRDNDDDDDDDRRKRRSLSLSDNDPESDIKTKRLCIVVEEKPPPPKIGEKMELIVKPVLDFNISTLYSFDVKLYTCLFWDELKDEWSTRGCRVKYYLLSRRNNLSFRPLVSCLKLKKSNTKVSHQAVIGGDPFPLLVAKKMERSLG